MNDTKISKLSYRFFLKKSLIAIEDKESYVYSFEVFFLCSYFLGKYFSDSIFHQNNLCYVLLCC